MFIWYKTKKNTLPLSERKKMAIGIIKEARDNKTDKGWLIPDNKIRHIKNPKVYPFKEYEHLNKLKISGI